ENTGMNIEIPKQDAAEWSNLKDETRAEVRGYLRAIGRLLDINKGLGAAIKAEAADLGVPPKTLYRKFDDWRNGCKRHLNGVDRKFRAGDWRMLVNYSKEQPVAQSLPTPF